ncbi:MAG: hypothetical protein V3U39_12280 [Acidimicrobiia bacterium]
MVGLPPEHLASFNWQVFAAPKDALVLDLADRSGNPVLMFWSPTPARCAVIADVNIPGAFELLVHEFSVGSGPEPEPDPKPDPKPDPAEVSCLLLYESADVAGDAPHLGNITTSQLIRRLASANLHLLFADKDELDESDRTTPAVKTWVAYAAKHKLGLPRWFIVNERTGDLIATAEAPRTVAETVKLLGRYAP